MQRLRQIMRGYRYLYKTNTLDRINNVKHSLEKAKYCNGIASYSSILFGSGSNLADTIIHQFLTVRIAGLNLNKSLLFALGKSGSKVVHPLPPAWRNILEQHGFKVAKIRSALAWNGFIILMLAYGFALIAKRTFKNIKSTICSTESTLGRYAYFDSLTTANLPQPCEDGQSQDIITWYQKWNGREHKLDTLCHGVKGMPPLTTEDIPVISINSAVPPLTVFNATFQYIRWGILACAIAIVDFFRGRWWHAIILSQASTSALVRYQRPEKLARDYLCSCSDYVYRPLWTYDAEKKGSRIICYFYSANCEGFKRLDGYPSPYIGWRTATWPKYLTWDNYQADFIKRSVNFNPIINVVGSISYTTSSIRIPFIPSNSIAVFDVQPMRDSLYQISGIDFDYYIPENCCKFLTDISDCLNNYNMNVAFKRKRSIGKLAHNKYRNLLSNLEKQGNFIAIDANIPAQRVITKCIATISMPFTSTALIGKELGKPSVYYDPLGMIQKDDRAAHGIPILSGPDELNEWLDQTLNFINIKAENIKPI